MGALGTTLEDIKARMTEEQRRDMAEIIQAEVNRREGMKKQGNHGARPAEKSGVRSSSLSNGLSASAIGEIYHGIDDKIKNLRLQKLDEKIANARRLEHQAVREVPRKTGGRAPRTLISRNGMLVLGIVLLATLKVASASGAFSSGTKPSEPEVAQASEQSLALAKDTVAPAPDSSSNAAQAQTAVVHSPAEITVDRKAGNWTPAEKQVLTELDARRVELEKRRQALDQREEDIKNEAQALAERLAELKTLGTRMSQVRHERDNQYEARLEQLANVYGSMVPNEAAPLVNKLDEDTALALLKRMPGKRMGQILSLMEPGRAVDLTRILSDKNKLDDVPAK